MITCCYLLHQDRFFETTKFTMTMITEALHYATKAHEGQTRRNSNIPHVEHCIGVKEILEQIGIQDEVILSAALLHVHRTMEDCDDLTKHFGEDVTKLVLELTDNTNLSRDERHREQALKMAKIDERSVLIKMADRIYNSQDFMMGAIKTKQL